MSAQPCPGCRQVVVPATDLFVSDAQCPSCGRRIGVHRLFGAVFFVLISVVTVVSTVAVFARFGLFAALFRLPFPVGALGYLKARLSPLVVRSER